MSGIEELEQEIREKQAELKRLKQLANPHFSFSELNKQLDEICARYGSEHVTDSLRTLVSYVVCCRIKTLPRGRAGHFPHYKVKVKEMTPSQLKRGNEMIGEIIPIIVKYTEIALEENKEA